MIAFLYKRRDDGTYVIEKNGMPYHVTKDDPLYENCLATYGQLDEEPPDEPAPKEPTE